MNSPMIVQIENNVAELANQAIETQLIAAAKKTFAGFPLLEELAAEGVTAQISILLSDCESMQALNREYMNSDDVTDVLSFPSLPIEEGVLSGGLNAWDVEIVDDQEFVHLGDIAICPERAAEQASRLGRSLQEEMVLLTVHGCLHLLGFDHGEKAEETRMFSLQESIIQELEHAAPENFRAGYVAIIGRPNVGKSTLMNYLIGTKIAIISPKPQTTQKMIRGVYTDEEAQIVLLDTPGIHQPSNRLGHFMLQAAEQALLEADVVCLMIEAGFKPFVDTIEHRLLQKAEELNKPVIIILNKTDIAAKEGMLPLIDIFNQNYKITSFVPISARSGEGVDILIDEIKKVLPLSEPLFSEENYSDQTERMLAAELIRESILYRLQEELPYGIAVMIESIDEEYNSEGKRTRVQISATVLTERESHKRILLGKGGNMIKNIGINSRENIEKMVGCPVDLSLFVKVRADWRNKPQHLRELDFENRDLK